MCLFLVMVAYSAQRKNKVVLMRSLMLMLMSNFGIWRLWGGEAWLPKGGRSSMYSVNSCLNGVQRGIRFGPQTEGHHASKIEFWSVY